jgi:hypothetical protein
VKAGEWKGFSVEGIFDMEKQGSIEAELKAINDMIKQFLHN